MKTKINRIDGNWKIVKNKCRRTVNKDATDIEPTKEFIRMILISEHSPIRLINVDWTWRDIEYWLSTEWSRHKFEKFISTQRDDRTSDGIPRDDKPQGAKVTFDGYANAQQLIDSFRKRLCHCSHPKARELAEDFKRALHEVEPELADVLVPNCIYRCGCPEPTCCGIFKAMMDAYYFAGIDITDIKERYKVYNDIIYKKRNGINLIK